MEIDDYFPQTTYQLIHQSKHSSLYKQFNQNNDETGSVLKMSFHKSEDEGHTQNCFRLQNEYNTLRQLRHPHILKVLNEFHSFIKFDNSEVCFIQLDLAQCSLLELIQSKFPEQLPVKQLQIWFKQIVKGLNYIHKEGIVHNDIKLENILIKKCLNSDNQGKQIMLCDFEYARKYQTLDKEQQIKNWMNRAQQNMAPEIQQALHIYSTLNDKEKSQSKWQDKVQVIDEKKSDIFQLGILFFEALFLQPPCNHYFYTENDDIYRFICQKNFEKFWNLNEIKLGLLYLSSQLSLAQISQLKLLLQSMLAYNPQERISLQEIMKHPFLAESD